MKFICKSFLFVAFISSFGLSSCTGLLDITPVHSMKPETPSDYESILLGGYPRQDYFLRTELLTDNVYYNFNSTQQVGKAEEAWFVFASSHILTPENGDPYWGLLYKSVFYANTVLDKFKTFKADQVDKVTYERVMGEALALRAYAYFYLVNMYADVYSAANLQLPGVPMPLDAEDVNQYSKNNVRQPLGKVWGQIVADLDQASDLLNGKVGEDRHRFNYTSVQLLRARVALFMGQNAKAAEYATNVLSHAKLSDLNSMQDYINSKGNAAAFSFNTGFIDTDYNKEILFFTAGKSVPGNMFYYSQAAFSPTEELLDLTKREGDLTDYRQYIYESFADLNTPEGIMTGKTVYRMFATQEKYWYYIGLKTSEAVVIRAEAYAREHKYTEAVNDLNSLLVKRLKKDVFKPLKESDYTDKEDILKRVLEERRIETAFDGGLRFFDLRRLGKPEIVHMYKNGQEYKMLKNDPKYVLQIPQTEIDNSPEMPVNPR